MAEAFRLNDADEMLHYFRTGAEKEGSATDEEFDAVVDFCREYSQSLDWLFFGSPDVMICTAAKGSARARQLAQQRKRKALKGRGPSQFDLYRLPFFDKDAAIDTRCWTVTPTGNYTDDCDTGAAYAIEFLRSCDGTNGWRSLLAGIVTSMICAAPRRSGQNARKADGIVVGFMSTIGAALNLQNVTSDVADALERARAEDKAELGAAYAELRKAKPNRRKVKVTA